MRPLLIAAAGVAAAVIVALIWRARTRTLRAGPP